MITTTRTDCTRDNHAVRLPNATSLGFGRDTAMRGCWVMYESNNLWFVGRVICRVQCEGKTYVEVAQASADFSHVYVRWVEPAHIKECRTHPPRRVFEFFGSDNWDRPEDIHAALAYGVSDMKDQLKARKA